MSSFQDFAVSPTLLQSLERMKYTEPTPVQEQAIPVLLNGSDIIASAQTGTGKTAAFGIPLIEFLTKNPMAMGLVLAPTRELASQIMNVLVDLTSVGARMRITLLIGGVAIGPQRQALRQNPRIIVATPGRLVDHLEQTNGLLSKVRFLVLDEADRMLDLGFAPQLGVIRRAVGNDRQTAMFSATFPTDIAQLSKEWLREPTRVSIGTVAKPVERIAQAMKEINNELKSGVLLEELGTRTGSVIVFARTKRRTDRLARFLKEKGVSACQIHGDRSQGQRDQALSGFRSGRYRVMVATDIAARGIDVPHVEHVINFDLPMVAEDYLHRIGRTARAGRSGQALCLVSPEERGLWRSIQRLLASADGLASGDSPRFDGRSGGGGRPQGGQGRGGASRGPRSGGGGGRWNRGGERGGERGMNSGPRFGGGRGDGDRGESRGEGRNDGRGGQRGGQGGSRGGFRGGGSSGGRRTGFGSGRGRSANAESF